MCICIRETKTLFVIFLLFALFALLLQSFDRNRPNWPLSTYYHHRRIARVSVPIFDPPNQGDETKTTTEKNQSVVVDIDRSEKESFFQFFFTSLSSLLLQTCPNLFCGHSFAPRNQSIAIVQVTFFGCTYRGRGSRRWKGVGELVRLLRSRLHPNDELRGKVEQFVLCVWCNLSAETFCRKAFFFASKEFQHRKCTKFTKTAQFFH